ncbi:hypothetical protein VTI74DRAFT_9801 [Chaetomium olivicolor]
MGSPKALAEPRADTSRRPAQMVLPRPRSRCSPATERSGHACPCTTCGMLATINCETTLLEAPSGPVLAKLCFILASLERRHLRSREAVLWSTRRAWRHIFLRSDPGIWEICQDSLELVRRGYEKQADTATPDGTDSGKMVSSPSQHGQPRTELHFLLNWQQHSRRPAASGPSPPKLPVDTKIPNIPDAHPIISEQVFGTAARFAPFGSR